MDLHNEAAPGGYLFLCRLPWQTQTHKMRAICSEVGILSVLFKKKRRRRKSSDVFSPLQPPLRNEAVTLVNSLSMCECPRIEFLQQKCKEEMRSLADCDLFRHGNTDSASEVASPCFLGLFRIVFVLSFLQEILSQLFYVILTL